MSSQYNSLSVGSSKKHWTSSFRYGYKCEFCSIKHERFPLAGLFNIATGRHGTRDVRLGRRASILWHNNVLVCLLCSYPELHPIYYIASTVSILFLNSSPCLYVSVGSDLWVLFKFYFALFE